MDNKETKDTKPAEGSPDKECQTDPSCERRPSIDVGTSTDDPTDPLDDSISGEFPLNSSSDSETLHKRQRTEVPSPHGHKTPSPKPFMVAASPPKFVSIDEILKAADGVSNMTLAHEIAVDADFKIEKTEMEDNSLEKRVKEIMHKAFWDALDEKLKEDPPDYSQALILLQEIRESLHDLLLPHHHNFRAHINEVLDLDLIEQQAEHGSLDFKYYANFVISIMARLCAPIRDEQVVALTTINDIVPLFKEIFSVLDVMKMDLANFTIQQVRPFIQQQSVEYERKKFQDFLKQQEENNLDGLLYTKEWLTRNADKLQQGSPDSPKPTPEGTTSEPQPGGSTSQNTAEGATAQVPTSSTPKATSPNVILNTAYMELLSWDDNWVFPETLLMDQERLYSLREVSHRLTIVASFLLVTYNTVGGAIAGIKDFKEKLKKEIMIIASDTPNSELEKLVPNISDHVLKEVDACLEEHGFTKLDEKRRQLLHGQIRQVIDTQHPVHKLLKSRIHGFIYQLISTPKPQEMRFPPGVSAIAPELNQICGQFLRLISHNRSVFGSHYADIISSLIKRSEEVSS